MNRYACRRAVYYGGAQGRPKEKMVTTVLIDAPSPEVAQVVLDNYGMESMKRVSSKAEG